MQNLSELFKEVHNVEKIVFCLEMFGSVSVANAHKRTLWGYDKCIAVQLN